MQQSDLLMTFLLRHRGPGIYQPPQGTLSALLSLSSEDLQILDQGRRLKAMTTEETEAECREIERGRRLADEAKTMVDAIPHSRGNGHSH